MVGKLIDLRKVIDSRGGLVFVESSRDIDFEIKRIYYIFDLNDEKRGLHAHKELKQVIICVHGSCTILLDDGQEKVEYLLNDPTTGLCIDKPTWREMYNFSDGCVLLVLASEYYVASDYIHHYDEFIEYTKSIKK